VPDGLYYFQVTDPSGAVLLSTDDISCRQVQVTGGRIVGASGPSCKHANGTFNGLNLQTPVQLIPFDDTPNPGGEYKAWITPVASYGQDCPTKSNQSFGFCESESKTDNFKVKRSDAAYVTVCKFNDVDGDGSRNAATEPLIPHWPIYATGVIAGTENALTDDFGCVSFAVSTFSNGTATVTLTEGTPGGDWTQTAPADGSYDPFVVTGGVISVAVHPGDAVQAPDFGNHNPFCDADCNPNELQVSKNAYPSLKRTYAWGIAKDVDKTEIDTTAGGSATFHYTVNVTHDAGTDSGWAATGTITVANPSGSPISGVDVTDAVDNGGNCVVAGGTGLTINAASHVTVGYSCSYSSLPDKGTNTATASATNLGSFTGTASVDFAAVTINAIDDCVDVTDTIAGSLGQVCSSAASPKSLTYANTVTAPSGTCKSYDNTATFTTNTSGTTGSDSRSAKVCGGADLAVAKTASGAYDSTITKDVNKTLVEQAGSSFTFNYTVTVTEKNWKVSGNITVTNPNDWEAITASVADVVYNGGVCIVDGGASVLVAASSSATLPYSCTYATPPPSAASGTNKATATWDKDAAHTADGSSSGSAGFTFASLTVKDTFDGTTTTLGTISGITSSKTYTYSHTVSATGGSCTSKDNTAEIVGGAKASRKVTLCNTTTGALTMGFWQNKNGQAIITGQAKTGVCPSTTWLRQYAPFQDLAATSTCAQVGTYVTNIIKSANASGAAMNAMLKGQMLATALDVYFSDPSLGGNKISAAAPLGGVKIDLTQVCKMIDNSSTGAGSCSGTTVNASGAFGGATSLTVSQLLAYAASQSNIGGSIWYGQVKATQELAKNTFDEINNQAAYIAP
jgi:hypothetical protein